MAIDPKSLRTRRSLLTAAIGGLAALGARAVGAPDPARAAGQGEALVIGTDNTASRFTGLTNGQSQAFLASGTYGIAGTNGAAGLPGVQGHTSGTNGQGVHGTTSGDASQTGVLGDAVPVGIGVRGTTTNGIGVIAESTGGGYGLQVKGLAVFDRSGRVTFNAGQSAKVVKGVYLGPGTLVLATIQGDIAGTWVRGVSLSAANTRFTIRLNKAAPSS